MTYLELQDFIAQDTRPARTIRASAIAAGGSASRGPPLLMFRLTRGRSQPLIPIRARRMAHLSDVRPNPSRNPSIADQFRRSQQCLQNG
jgi:hypothetical protein